MSPTSSSSISTSGSAMAAAAIYILASETAASSPVGVRIKSSAETPSKILLFLRSSQLALGCVRVVVERESPIYCLRRMASSSGAKPPAAAVPITAKRMRDLLTSMGADEYEPRVLHQLLEFMNSYATDMLQDAALYAEHAGHPGEIEVVTWSSRRSCGGSRICGRTRR